MRKIYQLDTTKKLPIYLYSFDVSEDSMPFFCVEVEPPAAEEGKVAVWQTELDSVADLDFGKLGTGNWILKDDNRSAELFFIDDGARYEIGKESDYGKYDGLGPIPEWLTKNERPSNYHSWSDGQWSVNADDETRRLEDLAAAVRQRRDALIAQSDWTQLEDSPLKDDAAWLSYRQALRDITLQPGFPENLDWPEQPQN